MPIVELVRVASGEIAVVSFPFTESWNNVASRLEGQLVIDKSEVQARNYGQVVDGEH